MKTEVTIYKWVWDAYRKRWELHTTKARITKAMAILPCRPYAWDCKARIDKTLAHHTIAAATLHESGELTREIAKLEEQLADAKFKRDALEASCHRDYGHG